MDRQIIHDVLSVEQEQELAKRIESGDQNAVNELVLANRKLVAKIASDYVGMGVNLEDLIGAGNIGLVKAAQRYRSGMSKFSTYAQWRIKKHIRDEVSKMSGAVSIGTRNYDRDKQIRQARRELGENATMKDIARKVGSFESHVRAVLTRKAGDLNTVSLQENVGDGDDDKTWMEIISDDGVMDAYENAVHNETLRMVMSCLQSMSRRERIVLEGRFGLIDGKVKTLDGIGRELNLSKEMVRVIEKDALKKLHSMVTA